MIRRLSLIAAVLVTIVVAAGAIAYQRFEVGTQISIFTGLTAKMMCSGVFDAGRSQEQVRAEDFNRRTSPGKFIALSATEVNMTDKSVSASLFGLMRRTAIYREGIGCTVAEGKTVEELRAQGSGVASALPPARQ